MVNRAIANAIVLSGTIFAQQQGPPLSSHTLLSFQTTGPLAVSLNQDQFKLCATQLEGSGSPTVFAFLDSATSRMIAGVLIALRKGQGACLTRSASELLAAAANESNLPTPQNIIGVVVPNASIVPAPNTIVQPGVIVRDGTIAQIGPGGGCLAPSLQIGSTIGALNGILRPVYVPMSLLDATEYQ